MQNPIITATPEGVWTRVAQNVLGGTIWPTSTTPKFYLHTFRLTGGTAPTLRTEGAMIKGESQPVPATEAIDIYVWCVGGAGSVKVDTPYLAPCGDDVVVDQDTIIGSGTLVDPFEVANPYPGAPFIADSLTGSGTEADPYAVADPSEGGKKLQRVDTEAWEYPRQCLFGNITSFAAAVAPENTVVTFEDDMPQEGDIFNIAGTTEYNGEYEALNVDTVAKTCEIVAAFVATETGTFSFFAPYFSPDQSQKPLVEGEYITRYYYGALEDSDVIGPVVDALCGVHFVVENSTDPLAVVYEPCRGRFFAGGESVSIAEIDGAVTVEITLVGSTLAITEAWTDVIVATGP